MQGEGGKAHYVASDPKASYTLINPKTDLAQYNPAMVEWVSPERTDYNLLPPDHLKPNYTSTTKAADFDVLRLHDRASACIPCLSRCIACICPRAFWRCALRR
eukprot:COSAG02_NODE_4566_length_5212_cov_3.031293_2_plen_103_part_00